MTHINSNTKERTFTHLTEFERGQIAAYLEEDLALREIARRIGRDVSTISRERDRGTVQQIDTHRETYKKYFPDVDRKSTRLNSSHVAISYAVFCLKKQKV